MSDIVKGTFDIRKPADSDGFSASQMRALLNALWQGDNSPLRPRCHYVPEDFEYLNDAACQSVWSGTGVTVTTNSTNEQEGSYCLQCAIDVTGDRQVDRTLVIDLSGFLKLKVWTRCDKVSSAIKFLLRDSAGNESYWNITTDGTVDTWKQDTLTLASPDSNNGTPATLSDIAKIGYKALEASQTYLFDEIRAEVGMTVYVGSSDVAGFFRQVWHGVDIPLNFAGGNSPTLTAPTTYPRIDLLTIDGAGTLAWTTGSEAASPTPPNCPVGVIPICYVYCKTTMMRVLDFEEKDSDADQGYVYRDIRPFFNLGGGTDEKVKADSADPAEGYLNEKTDNATLDVDTTAHKIRVKNLGIVEGKIGANAVSQGKLKTTTGAVSKQGGASFQWSLLTLPGGEYGFYPQLKGNYTSAHYGASLAYKDQSAGAGAWSTSYVTYIYLGAGYSISLYAYAQQRYITASSNTHWIFLLYNKTSKQIIAGYEAPDHPSYGNGEDEEKVPHPFADYFNRPLSDNLQIILLDNDKLDEIKAKRKRNKEILEIIGEEYEIDFESNPVYKPREIVEIDEFGDLRGEVISVIEKEVKKIVNGKTLVIQLAKTLKKRTVSQLPSYILYKSLKLKQ